MRNPATGGVLATVSTTSVEDCFDAITAADAALVPWRAAAPRRRAEVLGNAFDLMAAEREKLARLITRENGKALADARSEVTYAAEFFRWFSEEAVRIRGDYRVAPSGDKRIVVSQEPVGVSLLITPWNFPAAMATRKIAPALAAGCTVILKPAPETPLTALVLADLLQRAGVPDGVVNVVLPSPVGPVVEKMVQDRRVRNLSFTGSTEVGRLLMAACADGMVRCSMELGGNAPLLVLDDADLEVAVRESLLAKMRNGGAACTAANRFYVARAVADEFTERFSAAMGALRYGPGLDPDVELGALVSLRERDKIATLVSTAVNQGATCRTGGTVPSGSGAFYPATVLSGVSPSATILQNEIFGPVAPIVTVDGDDEAIRMANDSDHGLIAYVFSGDHRRAMRAAESLEAGMVAVNRGVVSDPAAPFGGVKQSGQGREGGFDGIHEFLETKYIAADPW